MKSINLLIGTDQEIIINFITEITQLQLKDGIKLDVQHAFVDSEIVQLAEKYDIDLFILQLNNIFYHNNFTPKGDFRTQGPEFIAYLKKKYNKPIIAMTVFDELEKIAIDSGASAFLKMPFSIKDFVKALRVILK